MISYNGWRKRINKSNVLARSWRVEKRLENKEDKAKMALACGLENKRMSTDARGLEMLFFKPKSDDQRFIKKLMKMAKSEKIDRKDRIQRLKFLIKTGQYHVSGKQLVDKWFPEKNE